MKFILKVFIFFTIFSGILLTNQKNLSPLSECFKGRVGSYSGWENGGSCRFEPHTNATGPYYIYPIAPNEDLFHSIGQCGVCYEIVGLSGVIRVRVEDFCPKNDESGYCSGDIYHINLPDIGLNYLIGTEEEDLSPITFRMVDCGFSGNIRILMDKESDKFAISFVVLDHNLAVSKVILQENQMIDWEDLKRDNNNYWSYDPGMGIEFPIKIKIYSIKGDYVTVNINELNNEGIFEADGNFKESNDTFFNITTLENVEMPNNTLNCCERDFSVFTPIYKNGEANKYYYINSQKVTFDYNSTEKYDNKNTMLAKFPSKGKLIFKSAYPIRADQYAGISIVIKTSINCTDCMFLNGYDLQKNINLNFDSAKKWKNFRFEFKDIGINNNEFNGIVLYYYKTNAQPFEIYIGSIDLIEKRNKPDAGVCLFIPFIENEKNEEPGGEESGNIPIHIPEDDNSDKPDSQENNSTSNKTDELTYIQTDIITEINTTIINDTDIISYNFTESDNITESNNITESDNNTESDNITESENISQSNVSLLTRVNILSIEQKLSLIIIKCENFTKIKDEDMILLFESKNNSNSFETVICYLDDEEIISTFSCNLPENITNGEYKISSPSQNKYFVYFPNLAFVNKNKISFDINIETQIETTILNDDNNSTNYTEISNYTVEITEHTAEITQKIIAPIIITNSIEQSVKKGDIITFQINSIDEEQFYLENNEIVLTDNNKEKILFLKKCNINNINKIIICTVSNNTMKGIYTSLIGGNNISIQPGHHINLQIDENIGGIVTESIEKTINISIPSTELKNFNLTFNILYFNSSAIPFSSFPHKVTLSGIKNNRRNLEEINYDSIINFERCITGNNSTEFPSAFGSIRCIFPDFVPAGVYSKLESDGFDVNPNSKINIVFPEDFNRNSNGGGNLNGTDDDYEKIDNKKSSSSSSKTWIIWVIAGLLLLILIIIVIIACIKKPKNVGDTVDNSKYNNDSNRSIQNSNQSKNDSGVS